MTKEDPPMYKIIVNSEKNTYSALVNDFNYIVHHGIKGQKWGVRRFQNEDGSYTPAGAERYNHRNSDGSIKGVKNTKVEASKNERQTNQKSVESHMKFAQKMKERSKTLKQLDKSYRELDKAQSDMDKEFYSNPEVIKYEKAQNEASSKIWEETNHNWREYSTRFMDFRKKYKEENPEYSKASKERKAKLDEILKKKEELSIEERNETKKLRREIASEIKKNPVFKEYDDARKSLHNVREETIGTNSKAYNDAYKKYVDSGKVDDYGFDHYMWRESKWGPDYGCKEYDVAAKEYKQKSKEYESKMKESAERLKADVLKGMTSDKKIVDYYEMELYNSYFDK